MLLTYKRTYGGFVIPCFEPVLITTAGFSWKSMFYVTQKKKKVRSNATKDANPPTGTKVC